MSKEIARKADRVCGARLVGSERVSCEDYSRILRNSAASTRRERCCVRRALHTLLEDSGARSAFSALIERRARHPVDADLTWAAGVLQSDGGRPDLEARTSDGAPRVKVEAKLGAGFGEGQLESYLLDLQLRSRPT